MILCVIPARGGSVGIPLKNLRLLAGKPLISYAIEAAKGSKLIDEIVVSTDHQGIAEVSVEFGARVPFLRPREISIDCPTELVVQHAVRWMEEHEHVHPDPVVVLQCTSPLSLKPTYIDSCIRAVADEGENYDSAMTVCPISEYPQWFFKIEDDILKPLMDVPLKGDWGVRQSFEKLYRPTGACYVTSHCTLMEKGRIIGDRCRGVVVPKELGIDIDTEQDLITAEVLLEKSQRR